MNRTDRLLAIVWLLRSRGRLSAAELARIFEVSERSIYRDVQALSEGGVPIVALPGPAGGYSLMEGFSLTPIAFSDNEVAALYLGTHLAAAFGLGPYAVAAQAALDKIAHVLPPAQEELLRRLAERVRPVAAAPTTGQAADDLFQTVSQAIITQVSLHLRYSSAQGDLTERTVDPYGLLFQAGAWYMVGACRLRGDLRMFRLDRIQAVSVCEQRFERPGNFELGQFVFSPLPPGSEDQSPVTVRLRGPVSHLTWYREHQLLRRCRPQLAGTELTLQLPPALDRDLIRIVLGDAGVVEVLEPESLRRQVQAAAAAAVERHQQTGG